MEIFSTFFLRSKEKVFGCQFLLGQKIFAMNTQFFARKIGEAPVLLQKPIF
jgi:hypothetical protein